MPRASLDTQRVIDEAASIADAEGLDAVTLTRVADRLGVRQPALYRHVEGYDDLLRSLGLRGREMLADRLSTAAQGVAGPDVVRALGDAWRGVVREAPGLYAATDRYPCAGDAELEDAVEEVVTIIFRSLGGFKLDEAQRIHVARALRSSFHGFAHLESGDGHPHPHDLEETFSNLVDLLVAGIRQLESTADTAA
ncbi:MAG: WHG domain-containing protein [Acidimicrobiales bacterium]|nr:WHG domain-containing protein [Acidimicrobiales bacterium]MDG1876820.1 WHG domain-containing protein [Acidimicrobiales bacterium]